MSEEKKNEEVDALKEAAENLESLGAESGSQEQSKKEHKSKESDDEPEKSSEDLSAEEKLAKVSNDILYLKAEFDNFRKRTIKERSDILRYGSAPVITALLEVMDNFDRALEAEIKPENLDTFVKGVKMISQELKSVLERFNVQEVPSLGEDFDPNVHEALSTEKTDQYEPGKISQVIKKPYKLHDRVIRPGQVVIADKPDDN